MKFWEIAVYIFTVVSIFGTRHLQNILVKNLKPEFQNKKVRFRMAGIFIPVKWLSKNGEKYLTSYIFALLFTFVMIFISMIILAYYHIWS
jgi:hypothetical protein